MTGTINLIAVYVADYAGVLILVLILLAKGWELPGRRGESRILLMLIVASMINCLIDPFIFAVDGLPGPVNRAVVVYGNSAIFLYNLIVGTGVLALVIRHINKKIARVQYMMIVALTVLETIMLIVNLFKPLVFYVDENNVYSRRPLYFLYIGVAFYLMVYSLVVYITAKIRDGSVRYFPVWEFIIPIICGVTLQTLFYGISTQPVSFALAFCSIVICLQKEYLYLDKLTGAYNRYELDKIIRHYARRGQKKFAAIMLDMNGFKSINDDFSHKEGDEALKNMARVLTQVVGNDGNVIRFAGDEFVIVMDANDDDDVPVITEKINDAINNYNATSGKPYCLSASIGGKVFDTSDASDVLGRIDRIMYENKVEYYKDHDRRSR